MNVTTIVTIALIVSALIFGITLLVAYLRNNTLEKIRADVYQLFLKAEHNPDFVHSGKQKMKWVLSQARMLLPGWVQMFITDACLEKIVEGWFRAIKDLLDDGKLNKSHLEEDDLK